MAKPIALTLALVLLAGCAAPAGEPAPPPADAAGERAAVADVGLRCTTFCEPTVAVLPEGSWSVTSGGRLAVSRDEGASFEELPMPPFPTGAVGGRGDGLVSAAPDGTLFYTSLMAACAAFPCAHNGIEVARSHDGGKSWTSTVLAAPLHADAMGADRQWVFFGPDGEVCLQFQYLGATNLLSLVPETHEVRVSCSTDGGETFPPFVAATPAGGVVVNGVGSFARDGRMLLPYFTGGQLFIAASDDGGATFSSTAVEGAKGSMFPSLVSARDGRLHLGWRSAENTTQVATSGDGGASWSAPATLSAAGDVVPTGPWLAERNGSVLVVWFAVEQDGSVRLAAAEGGSTVDLARGLEPSSIRAPATDFPHLALTADGRALVAFGDIANGTTRLAVVPPPRP